MRPRALLVVPALLALSTAIMWLGPYRELASLSVPDKPFDEVAAASVDEAALRLEHLGDRGRALYGAHFWWDLVFLLANAGTIAILILVAAPRAGASRPYVVVLLLLPMAWALADLVENVAVAQLVAQWESPLAVWVTAARSATTAKMVSGMAALLAAVASLLGWATRAVLERRSPRSLANPGVIHRMGK